MSPALTLRDAEGPVGSYDRGERDGHVYADLFEREPGVSPARAARAVLDQLAGYRIAGDEALGRELIAAGARRLRRAARRLPAQRPWLIEVFRHPAHRGVGRALCERALALATVPRLSLMVSEGNSARRLYEDLGFRVVHTALVVEI